MQTEIVQFGGRTFGRSLGLLVLLALVVLLYLPSFRSLVDLWSFDGYRHGYLIPFISLYLFFRQRKAFVNIPWSGSWVGLIWLAVSIGLWMIANAIFVLAVEHFAIFLIMNAFVLTVVGMKSYRTIAFSLVFLIFALPIGASLVPILMKITADISVSGLYFFGVPVFREGMLLTLPHGVFEVATVCSGLKYLNAGLALGVLAAYFLFHSLWRRILYVCLVAAVFIIANGVRVFIVMVVASATHMEHFSGYDHVVFGDFLFLALFVALIWLGERYSDRKPSGTKCA